MDWKRVGVEPEILITSRNKNVAMATDNSQHIVFSFGSKVVGLMACVIILTYIELTDLTPLTDTFPTFAFTYLSNHTLLLLCVAS